MMIELDPKLDFYTIFTFLGIVQGFFLSLFFLSAKNRQVPSNFFLGLFILCISILGLDSFLCYTNLMFKVIYLNDSTEPLIFLYPSLIYFYFFSKLYGRKPKYYYLHFLPALIYFVCVTPYLFSELTEKYNAYISAYHPTMDHLPVRKTYYSILSVKDHVNTLSGFWNLFYLCASIFTAYKYKFHEGYDKDKFRLIMKQLIFSVLFLVLFVFIKTYYELDLGDHFLTVFSTILIYLVSINVIRNSLVFKEEVKQEKYKNSSLNEQHKDSLVIRIQNEMVTNKFFLEEDASLPKLAEKLGTSANHVSQVINQSLEKTYNDLIAEYRVEESKPMILAKDKTIEEIAFSVGYHSKTSFNSAFKKITGQTPTQFRDSAST